MTVEKQFMLRQINIAASRFLLPQKTRETYTTIIEEAKELVGASEGSVILWQDNKLVRVYASNKALYSIKPRKKGRTYEAYILNKASYYRVKRVKEPHPVLKRLAVKTVVYIPLSYDGGTTIGVINLLCQDSKEFTNHELQLLELFGSLASLAINKAQLYTETKDSLDNQKLYLSLTSHEIKTPLTALYTYVQLLDAQSAKLDPWAREFVKKIRAEVMRINILVAEFLEGGDKKLAESDYSWQVCDIKSVVENAIDNFKTLFPHHKLVFMDEAKKQQPLVWGDFNKLLQVVNNILNNAGKFSPQDEKITLTLKNLKKEVAIYVKDNGKGISKNDIKHIFNKFYRSANETKSGMGLGLYLVKTVVTNHGGTIEAISSKRGGAQFRIKLPKHKDD